MVSSPEGEETVGTDGSGLSVIGVNILLLKYKTRDKINPKINKQIDTISNLLLSKRSRVIFLAQKLGNMLYVFIIFSLEESLSRCNGKSKKCMNDVPSLQEIYIYYNNSARIV